MCEVVAGYSDMFIKDFGVEMSKTPEQDYTELKKEWEKEYLAKCKDRSYTSTGYWDSAYGAYGGYRSTGNYKKRGYERPRAVLDLFDFCSIFDSYGDEVYSKPIRPLPATDKEIINASIFDMTLNPLRHESEDVWGAAIDGLSEPEDTETPFANPTNIIKCGARI